MCAHSARLKTLCDEGKRVRRTMVRIRPGAQAAAPNIKLRPPLLLVRAETMLASRMGVAVSCRAAAR
jgi:hypothetical protein